MRWRYWVILAAVFLAGLPVWAEETAPDVVLRRSTARAATARAVSSLYAQVASLPIGPRGLSVGVFLDRLDATEDFRRILQHADMVGGARWIDDRTCQVQLEISGARLAAALRDVASRYPRQSPVSATQIDNFAQGWVAQTFSASGSSAAASVLTAVQPMVGGAWAAVSDKNRQAALEAAKADATEHVIASVEPVSLGGGNSVGDALRGNEQPLRDWLVAQPIRGVEFHDSLQVDVMLAVDEVDFYHRVEAALKVQHKVALPGNDDQWGRVEEDFYNKLARPVGRARAIADGGQAPPAIVLPAQPPAWVDGDLRVDEFVPKGPSKLKEALMAEAQAKQSLRHHLESLPLDGRLTVGAAAAKDPRIAAAVDRAVAASRITKTQYFNPGARVWIDLDLRVLWDEMRR